MENTDSPLLSVPVYSIRQIFLNELNANTGNSPLIKIYDLREQETDSQKAEVTVENSDIRNFAGTVIETGDFSESQKSVQFIDRNNDLSENMMFLKSFEQYKNSSWNYHMENNSSRKVKVKL